ncbi:hypothetical protein ABIA94_009252 [Bradyrhizobium sp. LA7.1]
MMRRDAKVTFAYSGLAELKAALDPRQRFVDEITPIGRSMAEVSRGGALALQRRSHGAVDGRLHRQPSCLRQELRTCRCNRKYCEGIRSNGSRFHRQARSRKWHQPHPWQVLDLFQLGCISKMRGTNRSDRVTTARLRASLVPLPNGGPRMPNPARTRSACFGARRQRSSNGCLGPALLPGGVEKWRRARGRTLN